MPRISKVVKKYKVTIAAVVAILAILLIWSSQKNKKTITDLTPSLTPTPTTTSNSFRVTAFYPREGEVELEFPTTAIGIQFSQAYDINEINIQINPKTNYYYSQFSEADLIYVTPDPEWKYDTEYTIDIDAKNLNGQILEGKKSFTFKLVKPPPTEEILDERQGKYGI